MSWNPNGYPPARVAHQVRLDAYDEGLLAALREHPWPLSTREVTELAGATAPGHPNGGYWPPDGLTGQRLRKLAAAGRVVRTRPPNDRAAYWSLAGPVEPLPDELVTLDVEAGGLLWPDWSVEP